MSSQAEMVIYNTHCQLLAAGGGVAICAAYTPGRNKYFSGWGVYRVNADGKSIPTNTNGPWYEYGCKVFSTFGSTRAEALAAAKAWIAEQGWYSGEWKRNSMRDYVPAEINKRFPIRKTVTP